MVDSAEKYPVLKSIQFQKRFSWSDGSKYKSQSRHHEWGGEFLHPTSKSLCSSNHEREYLGYEATMLHTMSFWLWNWKCKDTSVLDQHKKSTLASKQSHRENFEQ